MLYGQTFAETLISAQVDGAAVTAAAATTLLPAAAKALLPANFFSIGRKMRINAWGRISNVTPTPGTARFDVRFGATVVFDSLAVVLDPATAYTNTGWYLSVELTCRAIGTTGNLMGQGLWLSHNITGVAATPPKAAGVAMLPWNSAPAVGANFDTTASQVIDLFFTQTAASGSCTLHQFEVLLPN